jgi:hypoxanthine-DNA glycosylase
MIRHVIHPYQPIVDKNSKVLVLGSVPSVKSVENGFYYGNPFNRFWKIMSLLCNHDLTNASNEEKTEILLNNNIALYDVVYACDIVDSNDDKISNIEVSDIEGIINNSQINHIFLNGNISYQIFKKYFPHLINISSKLPSTSPRNARYNINTLYQEWKVIQDFCK